MHLFKSFEYYINKYKDSKIHTNTYAYQINKAVKDSLSSSCFFW